MLQTLKQNPLPSIAITFRVEKGEYIFCEGEEGHEFFIILNGHVDIQIKNKLIITLGPNDIFGEMAIIDDAPRSATAIAKTTATLLPVSKKDFFALVQRKPEFALDVIRTLTHRLRRMNQVC